MKLMWMGTAALMLKEEDRVIAIDPFMGIPPRHEERMLKTFRTAGDILVTHGHFDHIEQIPRIYENSDVTIHCTNAPYETLKAHGVPEAKLARIAPGDALDLDPFAIDVYHSVHCQFDKPLIRQKLRSRAVHRHPFKLAGMLRKNKTYPENGEIVFYEIRAGGQRLQVLGSMGFDEQVAYPTGADLLVLPLQGRSDQDTFALSIVQRLLPKRIVIDHYDDAFSPMTDPVDPSGFIRNVEREFGIPTQPMTMFDVIDLEKL